MKRTMSWMEVCEAFWGPDWIAPISEVLHVNRRTVERWKSGKVPIPAELATMIVAALPDHPRGIRELGGMLRHLANGATDQQISDQVEAYRIAYQELNALQLRRSALLRLAAPMGLRRSVD